MRAVVYGLGWFFDLNKSTLKADEIVYYCDKEKKGKTIGGIKIIGLEDLGALNDYDAVYVTTTEKWWQNIVDDLLSVGVPVSKIRFPLYQRFPVVVDGDGTVVAEKDNVRIALRCSSDFSCFDSDFNIHEYGLNFPFDDTVVFDIGMNSATTALYFATFDNVKRVYGFEPFQDSYNNALDNISRNPDFGSKIVPFNYALSKREEVIEVPVYEDDNTGSRTTFEEFFGNPFYVQGRPELRKEIVVCKNARKELEQLVIEDGMAHYVLKIDVEGSEFDIFSVLKDSFVLDAVEAILMEFHRKPDFITKILEQRGFRFVKSNQTENQGMIYAFKWREH